jgi:hypothetical protein
LGINYLFNNYIIESDTISEFLNIKFINYDFNFIPEKIKRNENSLNLFIDEIKKNYGGKKFINVCFFEDNNLI